ATIDGMVTIGARTGVRHRVIGVLRDTRYRDFHRDTPAILYQPFWQARADDIPASAMFTLRIEAPVSPAQVARERHLVSPRLVALDLATMSALIDRTLTTDRLIASLSVAFGLLAIAMAAAGLYALMSSSVARRTHEMGIRAALGADPTRLATTVVAD